MNQTSRYALAALLVLLCAAPSRAIPQAPRAAAHLTVTGDVEHPLSLSIEDFRKMPRTTLKVTNPHEHKDETHEGVALAELL